MTHYVCTGGCEAQSSEPGFCQEETCAMYGAPLTACECSDGNHEEAMADAEAADDEDGEDFEDDEDDSSADLDGLDDYEAEDEES